MVLLGGGRHSSQRADHVVRYALHPPRPPAPPPVGAGGSRRAARAFDGQGMWIWYVSQSDGGNLAGDRRPGPRRGREHAVRQELRRRDATTGLSSRPHWCRAARERPEGRAPGSTCTARTPSARPTSARGGRPGADCLVIDAESEYEGHYSAAQTYIDDCARRSAPAYPVGLASFPYVYYHEPTPTRCSSGPNGAQFNAPQMYWKDIGTTVDTVYAHTYTRIASTAARSSRSGRPTASLRRANCALPRGGRRLRRHGLSWWDWQETSARGWARWPRRSRR